MLPQKIEVFVLVGKGEELFDNLQAKQEPTLSEYQKTQAQLAIAVRELDEIIKPLLEKQRELVKKWHDLDNRRMELEKDQKRSAIKWYPTKKPRTKKAEPSLQDLIAGLSEEAREALIQELSRN